MNHGGFYSLHPPISSPVVGMLMPGHRVSRERSLLEKTDRRQV
jgi:hypothetical protein